MQWSALISVGLLLVSVQFQASADDDGELSFDERGEIIRDPEPTSQPIEKPRLFNDSRLEGAVLVSRGRPSSQSSNFDHGVGFGLLFARYGNDGKYESRMLSTKVPCAITNAASNNWWVVELNDPHYIYKVRYWGRGDGPNGAGGFQTQGLRIEASVNGVDWKLCGRPECGETSPRAHETNCNGVKASKVRFTRVRNNAYLSLCEVEVFGVNAEVEPGSQLISRGKPTSQSGDWDHGFAILKSFYGNDGNYQTNLVGTQTACAITTVQPNAHWKVDFQLNHKIYNVHIFGRSDGYPQTLPVKIETSVDGSNWKECTTINGPETSVVNKANCNGVVARYLRIIRQKTNDLLSLCEVDVYGKPEIEGHPNAAIVSRSKPTWQSSTFDHDYPSDLMYSHYGNDGHYEIDFIARRTSTNCAIMNRDLNSFWTVNLQGTFRVLQVNIWGRIEIEIHQLLPLKVEVSPNDWGYASCGLLDGPETVRGAVQSVSCNGIVGSFVRITRNDDKADYLTICEVEVIGEEILP